MTHDDRMAALHRVQGTVSRRARLLGVIAGTAAILAMLSPAPAYAFRSTKHESFTDPDYVGYKPQTVVLLVIAQDFETRDVIEERMIAELKEHGVKVYLQSALFPPTRNWTEEAQQVTYEKFSIDTGIILSVGASASSVIPIATHTYSTATVFGNYNSQTGSFNAYGSGSSTSYNIYSARSEAGFSAVMLDLESNRTVWYADIFTKASGTLFVGQKRDARAAAKRVVRALEQDGHIGSE